VSRHFFAADTLQNKAYRDFVHELVEAGLLSQPNTHVCASLLPLNFRAR